MRLFAIIILSFMALLNSINVFACTCAAKESTLSELFTDNKNVVFWGQPIVNVDGDPHDVESMHYTAYRVIESYKGELPPIVIVEHDPFSTCGSTVSFDEPDLVYAVQTSAWRVYTSGCRMYPLRWISREAIDAYFKKGEDHILPRHKCYRAIARAYRERYFSTKFELPQTQCEIYVPQYNAMHNIQPVNFPPFYETEEDRKILKGRCFEVISNAYDSERFTGKFDMGVEECIPAIPVYDRLIKRREEAMNGE